MAKRNDHVDAEAFEDAEVVESEATEVTEASVTEEIDEKKAALLAKRKAATEAYNAAKDLIRASYNDLKDLVEQPLYEAIVKVVGQARGAGTPRVAGAKRASLKQMLLDEFVGEGKGVGTRVNEMELFKKFKVGQAEMRYQLIIPNIKNVDKPEDRKWFAYDEESGDYVFVAEGADVPEGWDGYLPADEALL